jgi:hypothetical protein
MPEDERQPFHEIVGHELMEVSTSRSNYAALDCEDEVLETAPVTLCLSESTLSIENPYILSASDGPVSGAIRDGVRLESLIGATVEVAYSDGEELVLEFDHGYRLSISLRDEDFRSPEAASFEPQDGPIIVFS